MSIPFAIRDATRADDPFVLAAWKKQYAKFAPLELAFRGRTDFRYRHDDAIDRIYYACTTKIAHLADDTNALLGFACADIERGLLHFAYVKEAFRDNGIARALEAELPGLMQATHWTRSASAVTVRRLRAKSGRIYAYTPETVFPDARCVYQWRGPTWQPA